MSASGQAVFLREAREKRRGRVAFIGALVLCGIMLLVVVFGFGYKIAMDHVARLEAAKDELPKPAPFNCKEAARICVAQSKGKL
jgi:hypothetical protein